jgi:cyanophycinase
MIAIQIDRRQGEQRQLERGPLMPIGGAEDKTPDGDVLNTFVGLAGGQEARIAIIPAASTDPNAAQRYVDAFRRLGVAAVRVVEARTHAAADDEPAVAALRDATGIFMTGGDQARLAEVICGTRVEACLRERNAAGAVVAGTSAGAAIMAASMVASGPGGATPFKYMSDTEQGLGLLPNLIVDMHFAERDRTGRLLAMYAAHPELNGIGIDEDTAAVIDADMRMSVVGSGAVHVYDGSHLQSDIEEIAEDEPVMIDGAVLHVVTPRHRFDLRRMCFVR